MKRLAIALVLMLGCEPEPDHCPEPEPKGCAVFPPGVCWCGAGCFTEPPGEPCEPVELAVCEEP